MVATAENDDDDIISKDQYVMMTKYHIIMRRIMLLFILFYYYIYRQEKIRNFINIKAEYLSYCVISSIIHPVELQKHEGIFYSVF